MTTYNFTHKTENGKWEIAIDKAAQYGYFENMNSGGGGGLWFEQNRMSDFDGVFELPKDVIKAIRQLGFTVPRDFE